MSHAAPENDQQSSTPTLPRGLRLGIYAIATPVGAAAGVVAAAGPIVGPVVALVGGVVAAACTAAIGTTALGNLSR
ncbi:hypothetical protein [Leifsonia virtsii]|uniref:Uncharacterized protein n=1 Tax=Leifsonia virtsii TaxID=3035915 RepID=A0ABT8J1K1_9MICO|nr:hypothetical protein [Leifsonia virtsii]MDN4598837.1 hypothetical protein [Leifsonia virtsii]